MRDDLYDEDRLRADEEQLRRFYFNRGYADFQVVSAFGELDEATNEYTITITVEEGERYTFGDDQRRQHAAGCRRASRSMPLVETRQGDVYSAKDVEDSIIALTENLAGIGYAFAQVTPRGDRNFENRTISVVYTIDQGAKTYVERIEIRGNTRTRDYVIRREFDVSEGDAFNQVLIQRAKRRLEGLGFFETRRNLDRAGLRSRPGRPRGRRCREVDRRVLGRRRLHDRWRHRRTSARRLDHRAQLPRSRPVHQVFGRRRAGIRRTISCPSPSPISSAGESRPVSTSTIERSQLRRLRQQHDRRLDSLRPADHREALDADRLQFVAGGVRVRRRLRTARRLDPLVNACNISLAIIQGVETSPWIKSSVSGGLVYNTIDDMKNPHSGIYAQRCCGGCRPWRRRTVRQADSPRAPTTRPCRKSSTWLVSSQAAPAYVTGYRQRRLAHFRSVPEH